jgi:ATP/maltotriose-dependent transcriptional regulator MalT
VAKPASIRRAPAAEPSAAFSALMQQLDDWQALRYADPPRALQLLGAARDGWPPMAEAEAALLQARFAMQIASVHTVMGQHALAQPEFDAMAAHLRHPALAATAPPLRALAQRCATAGANARAVLAQALGDQTGALRAYLQALDGARALGDMRYQAHVLVNLANTYEESGLPAEAVDSLRQALPLAESESMAELVGDIHHNMGNALAAVGDVQAGLASNRRALACYAALPRPQKERYALVAIAERLLESGCPDQAQAALAERERRPEDYTNQQYEAYAAYLAGRIALAQRRPDTARAALQQALAISAGPLSDPVGQARARLQLARLALDSPADADADAEAQRQVQAALALLTPSQARRDLMQAHELAYQLARRRGHEAEALAHHERFHDAYVQCFNTEAATRAQVLAVRHEVDLVRGEAQRARLENLRLAEALAEISARLGGTQAGTEAPGQSAQPGDLQALGLTRREAEVLYWVAQGKTNEDVATILDASLSTVKKHLLKVFDKLGVENRTAAARAAQAWRG